MEIWKPIPDFERYEASNEGRIRNAITGRVLVGTVTRLGYVQVELQDHSIPDWRKRRRNRFVHCCVFAAMTGKWCKEGFDVHHVNEIKTDNQFSNLEELVSADHQKFHRPKDTEGTCAICGKRFERGKTLDRTTALYCSTVCNQRAFRLRAGIGAETHQFTCEACGNVGVTNRKIRRYCDRRCKSLARSKK